MKHYEWILFDADETLFHFDAFSGLQRMFAQFDVEFSADDYLAYQEVNKPLWIDYQNGDISAQELQHQRFSSWAQQLRVSSKDLNSAFLSAMADICKPLEGANSLVSALYGKVKLGIITNGFTELQQIRLERLGLREYFDILVISEQVGFAKPHQAIFEHALSIMGQPERNKVLMVGDNPDTDILGGINAGFETCWLNVHENPTPEAITPGYQVSSLPELEQLLFAEQDK